MKKLLLTTLTIILFSLSGMAQTGIYSGGIIKNDLRKTGMVFRPELGVESYSLGDYESYPFIAPHLTMGFQVTPRVFVGGGFGVGIGTKMERVTNYYRPYFNIPIHGDLRWYWFDGLSSPFVELNVGIRALFDNYPSWEFMFDLGIGYDYKNFDIKLSFPLRPGVGVSVGYNIVSLRRSNISR